MALKLIGDGGFEADSNTDKCLYTENRPPARGNLGSFACGIRSDTVTSLGASTTANLLCLYWNKPDKLCLIDLISVSIVDPFADGSGTTAGRVDVAVFFARNFTVSPSVATIRAAQNANGIMVYVPMNTDNLKLRRGSSSSDVAFLSGSVGADLGGTYSLDTNPLGRLAGWAFGPQATNTTVQLYLGGQQYVPIVDRTTYGQYPIVLALNEGLVFTSPVQPSDTNMSYAIRANVYWHEAWSY